MRGCRGGRVRRSPIIVALGLAAALAAGLAIPYRLRLQPRSAPEEALTRASDGAPLRVGLWRPAPGTQVPRAAVVFVHSPGGALATPYVMLYEALAREGMLVAVPWLRGYRGGHRPADPFEPARWDPLPDIAGAFALARAQPEVAPSRIFVVGHSLGGGYALLFGLTESTVAGVVSLSRLDMKSRLSEWPGYFDDSRRSFSGALGLQTPMSSEVFTQFAEAQIFAFERAEALLQSAPHPRLLLGIGSRERRSDQAWLAGYASRAAGAVQYHEFEGLTHSLNVHCAPAGVCAYDRRVIPRVASLLARWMRGEPLKGQMSPFGGLDPAVAHERRPDPGRVPKSSRMSGFELPCRGRPADISPPGELRFARGLLRPL